MIQYIDEISTKEVYITMFSLMTSIHYGVGGFLGNVIGGAVYNNYKGPFLCQYTALAVGVWLLIMLLYFHVIGFIRNKLNRE